MPEFTTNQTSQSAYSRPWLPIAIAVGVIFVYLFGLTIPLLGPDEPRYSQIAREMFESGDWVTPRLGGFNWFEKPALLYWLQAASYSVFGVSEFAARFGPALSGLGTIAALFWLGRHADVDGADGANPSWSFATMLALVACSSLGLIVFARGASFDIIVTFPITVSLVAYFVFERTKSTSALAVFYIFIGVALLAKGLIGIVFPFGIVAVYHAFSLELPSRKALLSVLWGIPLALLVASAWYVPVYLRNGWPFVEEFFIGHHFQRFTSNKYQHPQPFHFFFWVLPLMIFPWTPFLFAELWRRGRRQFKGVAESPDTRRLFRFAAAWLLVPLLFFSFSGSKLPGYILPAVPPTIVIAAIYLHRRGWRKGVLAGAAAMLALIVVLLVTVVPKFAAADSVKGLIAAVDARGYSGSPVTGFYTLSHNAEFYAPGRLIRDQSGKQKAHYRIDEIAALAAAAPDRRILILVPLEHLQKLQEAELLGVEVIADNTELAVVSVVPR